MTTDQLLNNKSLSRIGLFIQKDIGIISLMVMPVLTLYGCTAANPACQYTIQTRLEHIAFNVENPDEMAAWYTRNLRMVIKLSLNSPKKVRFIADRGDNIMFELYRDPDRPFYNFEQLDPLTFHIAFSVKEIDSIRDRLKDAGAVVVSPISTTTLGDQICMLRDPWGVSLQIIQRKTPILSEKQK